MCKRNGEDCPRVQGPEEGDKRTQVHQLIHSVILSFVLAERPLSSKCVQDISSNFQCQRRQDIINHKCLLGMYKIMISKVSNGNISELLKALELYTLNSLLVNWATLLLVDFLTKKLLIFIELFFGFYIIFSVIQFFFCY